MMKLYFSPASPFVRKCLVVAHELGLADRIERVDCAAHPVNRDRAIVAHNPLGQVPTLLLDDGSALYDSRVICEYLNALAGGELVPEGAQRWPRLTEQALADGMLNAALLTRYESVLRPQTLCWDDWSGGQMDKVACGLAWLEDNSAAFLARVDIGTIALACCLGYLDFRFPQLDWREAHPRTAGWFATFNERPAMRATVPA